MVISVVSSTRTSISNTSQKDDNNVNNYSPPFTTILVGFHCFFYIFFGICYPLKPSGSFAKRQLRFQAGEDRVRHLHRGTCMAAYGKLAACEVEHHHV